MSAPLVVRTNGDIIPSSDHNDVKSYVEDGTYRVNTSALNIQIGASSTEIIDSSGGVKAVKLIAPNSGGILFYASNGITQIGLLDESGNLWIKGGVGTL